MENNNKTETTYRYKKKIEQNTTKTKTEKPKLVCKMVHNVKKYENKQQVEKKGCELVTCFGLCGFRNRTLDGPAREPFSDG